jgi:magnesium-protoporphyrin IX monomethyl ester (oxidative) cyclase
VWESLACAYIGSYLKTYYHQEPLQLQFFDGFFDNDEKIVEGAANSDFAAFSCTSPQMKHAILLASRIKEENPKVKTVFGGHHPSSLPEQTKQHPEVDIVIVGEGETGMQMVLQYKKNVIYTPKPIDNLDVIPFPDRKLIHQERTLALTEKNDGERTASLLSGRGCPFHCIFCTGDHDVFGKRIRKRSEEDVLAEMEQLVSEWKVDFIKFADAEINSNLSWLRNFCHEKIRSGNSVAWGANVHAALIDYCTLELMHRANCREIWVGCESGSPRILTEMQKQVTPKQILNTFKWAKQIGIRRRAYFMIGFPTETLEDFKMTMNLAEEIDADTYGMTILCPYPGTKLYSHAYSTVDWSQADEYCNSFWRTKHFTNLELKALQAEFVERFHNEICVRQTYEYEVI